MRYRRPYHRQQPCAWQSCQRLLLSTLERGQRVLWRSHQGDNVPIERQYARSQQPVGQGGQQLAGRQPVGQGTACLPATAFQTYLQALLMYGVPAWQHCCGLSRVKEEFKAHWTVLAHAVHDTDMVVLQQHARHLVRKVPHPHDMLTGVRNGISGSGGFAEQRGVMMVSSLMDAQSRFRGH